MLEGQYSQGLRICRSAIQSLGPFGDHCQSAHSCIAIAAQYISTSGQLDDVDLKDLDVKATALYSAGQALRLSMSTDVDADLCRSQVVSPASPASAGHDLLSALRHFQEQGQCLEAAGQLLGLWSPSSAGGVYALTFAGVQWQDAEREAEGEGQGDEDTEFAMNVLQEVEQQLRARGYWPPVAAPGDSSLWIEVHRLQYSPLFKATHNALLGCMYEHRADCARAEQTGDAGPVHCGAAHAEPRRR